MSLRCEPSEFSRTRRRLTRREFAFAASKAMTGLIFFPGQEPETGAASAVALAKNPDRVAALRTALELLGQQEFRRKTIYLKASFNSADHFPATTDLETLSGVARYLRESNCDRLILVERSGMGITGEVWKKLEVPPVAKHLEIALLALEDIPADEWRREAIAGSHWSRGVEVPNFLSSEACVVQICNLKTHRFGGHFSASLKNSVGLIAKHAHTATPYNYMRELHSSPEQRSMIAEINQLYQTSLIVMDASRVFIDGGPEQGDLGYPEVIVASKDRVAVDAIGVALLRIHGAIGPITKGSVFEQSQIKRAVELGLGAKAPKDINFLTRDDASHKVASQITAVLEKTEDVKKP
jgi:uncharacterized protein (DUF362 family)